MHRLVRAPDVPRRALEVGDAALQQLLPLPAPPG